VVNQRAILVIEAEDPVRVGEVLSKEGLRVLTQKEALSV
jgi:hypothetical protein